MIWAVVLAAGESRRMGAQKLLLPYGGSTVIESVVRTALDSAVDETLVVLGSDRNKIRRALRSYPVRLAANKDFRRGMLSSVQAGFRALPGDAEAVVVMLGDQPAIPSEVIDTVVGARRSGRKGIVVPVHGGRRGHPVLIDTKYREEIAGLDPRIGLRQLLAGHAEDILEIDAGSAAVLRDMDSPEDYARELGPVTSAHKRPA